MLTGKDYVCYFRVSTDRQGKSGLGLEAQKVAVSAFLQAYQGKCLTEFVEVESGKRADRPQLKMALAVCKRAGATLLIAKLDRLARNVAFIANLLESGVEIAAADMPEANRMVLHILAAVAEQESRAISERTKAALAASKKPKGFSIPELRKNQKAWSEAGGQVMKARLDEFRSRVIPVVEKIQSAGTTTYSGIAEELNKRGIYSFRGGNWYASSVKNLILRNK